jgi:hypothetical protein
LNTTMRVAMHHFNEEEKEDELPDRELLGRIP